MSVSYSAHAPREPCRKHSRFNQPSQPSQPSPPMSSSYSIVSQAAELAFNVYVAAAAADRAAYDRRTTSYHALAAATKVSDEIDAVSWATSDPSFAFRQAARAAYDAYDAARAENDAAIAASDRSFAVRQAAFDAWDKLTTARAEVAARSAYAAPRTAPAYVSPLAVLADY